MNKSIRRKSFFKRESDNQSSTKSNKSVEHIVVYLPAKYPSCPPGLEKLIPIDHLFVRQGIRETEPPYEVISKTKYEVLDGKGHRIFLAKDSTDNILKLCCRGGCGQPFRLSIKDRHSGYEILAVNARPDCYGAMTASIGQNGMSLGFCNEELRCCSSNYIVIDAQGNEVFRIYDCGLRLLEKEKNKHRKPPKISEILQNEKPPTTGGGRTRLLNRKYNKGTHNENDDTSQPQNHSPSANNEENLEIANPDSGREEENHSINGNENDPSTSCCLCGMIPCNNMKRGTIRDNNPPPASLGSRVVGCLDSCISLISGGAEFEVYSCQLGVVIGRMSKQWEHLYDDYFNLVECFGVNFPRDLSARHKALMLGALFLLVTSND